MINSVKIAPSLLAADFTRLGDEVKAVEHACADMLHLDIMDGQFVPNISFGADIVAALRPLTLLPFDIHLMVHDSIRFIDIFAKAGADFITVHIDAEKDINQTVLAIRQSGKKVGIALKPNDSDTIISDMLLSQIDKILVMTVEPGFGGQKCLDMTQKIKSLRQRACNKNISISIAVDGGVNEKTIGDLALAGADTFIAGTAVFKNSNHDYTSAIGILRKNAEIGGLNG